VGAVVQYRIRDPHGDGDHAAGMEASCGIPTGMDTNVAGLLWGWKDIYGIPAEM